MQSNQNIMHHFIIYTIVSIINLMTFTTFISKIKHVITIYQQLSQQNVKHQPSVQSNSLISKLTLI